jgi:RiboL-PSP-HEPN
MLRSDLDLEFARIDELVGDMNTNVPPTTAYQNIKFRADLAGLLVVAIAATYENCVKEILYSWAGVHHSAFENYARRRYSKINSRITISDLKKYCDLYDPSLADSFKTKLMRKKSLILERTGVNIDSSYQQLLDWRHEFAHTGARTTTLEEATKAHLYAKRVLYVFAETLH